MPELTSDGQRIVNELAQRHGFSTDAVTHMLIAVINGNGWMAQFSHPEFGGSGQWMRGGMLMIGDMFNNYLKGRVDSLCSDIANIVSNQPGLMQSGSFQSQSQSSGGAGFSHTPSGPSTLFVPDPRAQWYPAELGVPNSSGSQNNTRYAYFANAHRLAVETGGEVWVYDTLNHQIGGFSQQQGSSGSITFSSQFGTVFLSDLPVVMRNGKNVPASAPPSPPASPSAPPMEATPMAAPAQSSNAHTSNAHSSNAHSSSATSSPAAVPDVFVAIERLADLKAKGILSEVEFNTKKAELLSRL